MLVKAVDIKDFHEMLLFEFIALTYAVDYSQALTFCVSTSLYTHGLLMSKLHLFEPYVENIIVFKHDFRLAGQL